MPKWSILLLICLTAVMYCVIRWAQGSLKRAEAITQCKVIALRVADSFVQTDCNLGKSYTTGIRQDGTLIVKDTSGRLLDVWGNPITINIDKTDSGFLIQVDAAGEDGIFGSQDDIHVQHAVSPSTPDAPGSRTGAQSAGNGT